MEETKRFLDGLGRSRREFFIKSGLAALMASAPGAALGQAGKQTADGLADPELSACSAAFRCARVLHSANARCGD